MSLQPGEVLGGCRVEELIARGGMGEVYRATQLSLDRQVALKVVAPGLSADPEFVERFRREAKAAAAIDHPHILPVYETGTAENGRAFLVMRLVRGRDLGALLAERRRLSADEVVTLLTPIADALDAAHAAGLVHRDIKPANVLLEERAGGVLHSLLTDFGLAKQAGAADGHTRTGSVLGTADYMAPEQASGAAALDGRVDVYAFGCMVYAALTGEVPFRRRTAMATLMAHVNEPVPTPSDVVPGVPRALDQVVARAMAKDPALRAASAGALMRWATGQLNGTGPPPPDAGGSAAAAPPTKPLVAAGVTVLLAAAWTAAYFAGASL